MTEKTAWETFKTETATLNERIKTLIREGNVRKVVVQHKCHTVAEFPLTIGVVGVLAAPVVAAISAIVALLEECTIHVEHVTTRAEAKAQPAAPESRADVEC